MFCGESSHLPLKINTSGVIPPIFASSLLLLPATVASFEEAGGGESEGFELAEEELVENAEGVGEGDPLEDRFTPEEDEAEDGPAYGEPDEVDSTEVDEDEPESR